MNYTITFLQSNEIIYLHQKSVIRCKTLRILPVINVEIFKRCAFQFVNFFSNCANRHIVQSFHQIHIFSMWSVSTGIFGTIGVAEINIKRH